MRAQPTASHFIHGQYSEDPAGAVIESLYPATGEVIARLHAATSAMVEAAVASAAVGQAEWAAKTGAERGRILRRAAEIIRSRNRELSELETLDTGKAIWIG
jgi:betaine-aldehyde dehydrogenase